MKKFLASLLAVMMLSSCCAASAATLTWWDHFATLMPTHQALFDAFEAETGVHVDYQNFDSASIKDSLDLAILSGQGPDIFPQMWGYNQEAAKYSEGLFAPMTIGLDDLPDYVKEYIVEGYTMFDGEVYSFPTMALNHRCLMWYNKELVSEVPATLAGMRELFKELTKPEQNQYAIALPLTDTGRMADIFRDFCSLSGGNRGFNYATGRYEYDSEIMKAVMQFFVDIWEDGSVHPASTELKTRTVRERWVNNECVFAIDGCWYPGSIKNAFGVEPLDKLAVAPAPVLDTELAAASGLYAQSPVSGAFYISSECKDTAAATQLLMKLLDDSYGVALAAAMDQPPLNTAAIAKADVHPVYVEGCNIMASQVGFSPEPQLRNPAVGEVYAEQLEIKPHVGDIYVGYVTGAVTDLDAAVAEYNEAMNAELDRAIAACQAMGVQVSREDWIFPNFVPGVSYTSEKYAELK